MAKKMLIDATHAEETRVVVVDGNKVEEFDFESENKRQLAGNIYLAKVTRVEPSLQAAFVEYGGNRHGFLAFAEIHPDYYQIPVADREALLAEEAAMAAEEDEEEEKPRRQRRSRSRSKPRAEAAASADAVETREVGDEIHGMEVVEPEGDVEMSEEEGLSPMERVHETLVEEPEDATGAGEAEDGEELRHDRPYRALDDASERDDEIESVAEEDVAEEIARPRKPKLRKYKIQEVIKVRQILLVQVVKEERGNKGAALTTYLSLAGRYCVLMPNTARGGGISRKITNVVDRKKLKEIAGEIDVPKGAGLIIRTAGAQRTKAEIKRDYEYLQRLWEQIRELTLKSIAPAKIYEEGDLIKRSIRDLYGKDIDEVLVEGEAGYRTAKDFMKMIMPSHAKNVKLYAEPMPLFARYQVESYLAGMFNPTVQLRSGGYIVIGITEALVSIDVNSGRATKKGSIEETALETNLEAAEEIARQLRLRDLAGLIVIDFIDMEERKNNAAVEKRFKDRLKTDRARIQVGRISGFGLLEMSRQRLRPGMLEATTQACSHCHGTGLVRSDDSLGLTILRQIEEEGTRKRSREVLVKAPVAIVNFLMNQKREHIAQIEARYGMSVRVEADPFLISPDFSIEKFKTATRVVEALPVISANASLMPDVEEEDEDIVEEAEEAGVEEAATGAEASATGAEASANGDGSGRKRRRRRRRRRGGNGAGEGTREEGQLDLAEADISVGEDEAGEAEEAESAALETAPETGEEDAKPKRSRSRSRSRSRKDAPAEEAVIGAAAEAAVVEDATTAEPSEDTAPEEKPKRKRAPRKKKDEAAVESAPDAEPGPEAAPAPHAEPEPEAAPAPEPVAEAVPSEPAPAAPTVPEPEPEPEPAMAAAEEEAKPKKKGWWSLR
jgi:ribonuclease E